MAATTLTTAEIASRLRAMPSPTRLERLTDEIDDAQDEIADAQIEMGRLEAERDSARDEMERLTAECDALAERVKALETELRSTICPAGGWTGQPKDMEPTVANCLAAGECGCSVGAVLAGCSKSDERDASHG
ncbi:hypothetical protein GJ689_24905 [Rhodoplanes serenus]|uniref:Uncharacterized protein n=1 Tax=Rhodoplanes serenus TaxID=200615 RepID=A0A9X4XQA5_9BRAD|nr:hypothetical protein [Rhodoplanes serenus]MTW19435.1 hypothetical protein [Rhodoplanes serenus]